MTTRYVLASCILFSCLGSAASVNAALTWSNQDTRCNGNQRIDYARLWGLNFGTDWIGICKRTKADKVSSRADGKTPSTCVQKADGSVWGEWKFSKHVSCKRKPVAPLTWGNVGHKCENAARIEYARLWGLRPGTDWTEICRRTKANKISQLSDGKVPSACVQKVDGSVWGEWKYSNHASCTARWGNFKKDHCVDIGHRQWSSRIWEQGSDPMLECGRTPAVVGGQHFAKPDRCKNLGAGGVCASSTSRTYPVPSGAMNCARRVSCTTIAQRSTSASTTPACGTLPKVWSGTVPVMPYPQPLADIAEHLRAVSTRDHWACGVNG